MAKRSIRKTDPEDTTAPIRRRKTSNGEAGAAPASKDARDRRNTDATAQAVRADDMAQAVAPAALTAEAQLEAPSNGGLAEDRLQIPHDLIAERAYDLYLRRGGRPGDPLLDWVTAEQELRSELRTSR